MQPTVPLTAQTNGGNSLSCQRWTIDSLLTLLHECTYDRIGILQGAVLPAFD